MADRGRLREARVDVLMGVLNGAQTLPDQLHSIARQGGVRWRLWCSDDGSEDDSAAVIAGFSARWPGRVHLRAGPGAGFAANYLHLLGRLPPECGLVALADQDDIWFADKLRRAAQWLGAVDPARPALYTAARILWYPARDTREAEPRAAPAPSFCNALIENIAPGNTIVLNAAAARLARVAARQAGAVFAHDWWLYALISGAGGQVLVDPQAVLLYRQHAGNAIGAGRGMRAALGRKADVLRGVYRDRIGGNLAALRRCAVHLTPANRAVLDGFESARAARPAHRLVHSPGPRPYRQTRSGSAAFWGMMLLGKV